MRWVSHEFNWKQIKRYWSWVSPKGQNSTSPKWVHCTVKGTFRTKKAIEMILKGKNRLSTSQRRREQRIDRQAGKTGMTRNVGFPRNRMKKNNDKFQNFFGTYRVPYPLRLGLVKEILRTLGSNASGSIKPGGFFSMGTTQHLELDDESDDKRTKEREKLRAEKTAIFKRKLGSSQSEKLGKSIWTNIIK